MPKGCVQWRDLIFVFESGVEQMSPKEQKPMSSSDAEPDVGIPFDDVEEVAEGGRRVPHRGVYLLPNLFTTGALFCGFYAIISAMHGNFAHASAAIFLAMFLDGMDGRVARMTNTQSAFGEQYDSLADMVSFGVAPALVMFSWALHDVGRWGWAAAFIYTACAALRLARFNTQIGVVDKKYFIGLASPAAAAILAATVGNWSDEKPDQVWSMGVAALTAIAGLLMVSNFRYTSFKSMDFRGRVPFGIMLLVVFVFASLIIYQVKAVMAIAILYALSAPISFLVSKITSSKTEKSE